MILWLANWLGGTFHGLSVFNYLTVRALFAALTAFAIGIFFAPDVIARLKAYKIGQNIRDDGPQTHLSKAGTPTMGGIIILGAITISLFFWGDLSNRYLWIVWLTTMAFGAIGFVDDYRKLVKKQSKGLSAKEKFLCQLGAGLVVGLVLYFTATVPAETQLYLSLIHI